MDEEKISEMEEKFSKKELIKMLNGIAFEHTELVSWLYHNHLKILREYEDTQGTIHIHFVNDKGGKDGKKIK